MKKIIILVIISLSLTACEDKKLRAQYEGWIKDNPHIKCEFKDFNGGENPGKYCKDKLLDKIVNSSLIYVFKRLKEENIYYDEELRSEAYDIEKGYINSLLSTSTAKKEVAEFLNAMSRVVS